MTKLIRSHLVAAAENGNLEMVRQLLGSENVNDTDICDGKTALHWASQFAECPDYPFEILELLLKFSNIDVNIRDKEQHTALHYAAENVCVKAVKLLAPKTEYADLKEAIYKFEASYSTYFQYKEVFDILNKEKNSRPEDQDYLNTKKQNQERLKQRQNDRYIPNINSLCELYIEYILPLYDKCLDIKTLENSINELSQEESRAILATFRRSYLGSNDFRKKANKSIEDKNEKLNRYIKKYDDEIVPTYHLIKHLEQRNEQVKHIQFFCDKMNKRDDLVKFISHERDVGHDALLFFNCNDKPVTLQITRAIGGQESGKQLNFQKQLLRQEGSAFSIHNAEVIKHKDGTYSQNFPGGDEFSTERHVEWLEDALKKKTCNREKKTNENDKSDWLMLTIDMNMWANEEDLFYEVCQEFSKKHVIKNWKRVFIFLENDLNYPEKFKRIWDSENIELASVQGVF